jgi:hypothetical protein
MHDGFTEEASERLLIRALGHMNQDHDDIGVHAVHSHFDSPAHL